MAAKINLVVRLQHWMDSVPGQTFLNYAYSWGASVVILGALFKLTHLPGGNLMLFLGMGTEVVVFFLSAFDRPFDKDEIGKELPENYETEDEIAASSELADAPIKNTDAPQTYIEMRESISGLPGYRQAQHGTDDGDAATTSDETNADAAATDPVAAARAAIAVATPEGGEPFENEAQRLAAIIRAANDELLRRAQAVLSPEMETATQTYIEKLQTLSETFAKVDEQSAKLTKDSEEMDNLNRTLTGINKVYELHLKSISLQVGTIDQINEQTHKLAQQIEELNGVYGRMIEALTINMRGGSTPAPQSNI